MTLKAKIALLMVLWLLFAVLLIYLAGLLASKVTEASRAGYNIYARTTMEVQR